MKKPFRETKVGKFLKEKLPDVLDAAAGLTGIDALHVVSDLIDGKEINHTDRLELEKLMLDYELDIMRIELDNVKSARDREVGVVTATGKPDYAQWIVGVIGIGIATTVILFGLFGSIVDREIFMHVLGIIEGALLLPIFNYYFGSSIGSKSKEKMLK